MQIGITIKVFTADGVRICNPECARKAARFSRSLAFWSTPVFWRFESKRKKRRSSAALQNAIARAAAGALFNGRKRDAIAAAESSPLPSGAMAASTSD